MTGFVDALGSAVSLADPSPGPIGRLQSDSDDATGNRVSDDERLIATAGSGSNRTVTPTRAVGVSVGHRPNLEEAMARIDHIAAQDQPAEPSRFSSRFRGQTKSEALRASALACGKPARVEINGDGVAPQLLP